MTNIRNIAVIGAGGIGSWACRFIAKARKARQIGPLVRIVVFDDDIVSESNLGHQDYTMDDFGQNKAEVMAKRYPGFEGKAKKVTSSEDLKGFDFVIMAVDNSKTRKLIFETCEQSGISWLDMRANERQIAYYLKSPQNTLGRMLKTIGSEDEKGSCQRPVDIKVGKLAYTCIAIAAIGNQVILNVLRGEPCADEFVRRV